MFLALHLRSCGRHRGLPSRSGECEVSGALHDQAIHINIPTLPTNSECKLTSELLQDSAGSKSPHGLKCARAKLVTGSLLLSSYRHAVHGLWQVSRHGEPVRTSLRAHVKLTFFCPSEGVGSLWNGGSAVIARAIAMTACQVSMHSLARDITT